MWCDVINSGCDSLYSVSDDKHIVGAMSFFKGCDIMERVGVRPTSSGCDGTNIVNMLLYTMDMMSTYIEEKISKIDLL